MKTFESEFNELSNWLLGKTNTYLEKMEKEKTTGHDSKLSYEQAQNVKRYNRRLLELKKKYGKEEVAQGHTQSDFGYAGGK